MFERFTDDARSAVAQAQDHARRLGHSWIGCEHLLLALVSGSSPAAVALRAQHVTPEGVEEQIVRLLGFGGAPGLDRDALAAIGIDLDQVSAAIEATFGKDALTRAGVRTAHAHRKYFRLRRRRASCRRGRPAVRPQRTEGSGSALTGHLPFTARAKKVLECSLRESQARHDGYLGAEHLALALVGIRDGIVPRILYALGTSPAALISAITDRYRQAG
jgi:ATP-dependent Clp protease ATP-binding subunit ClpA